jgi:hypothetical protein
LGGKTTDDVVVEVGGVAATGTATHPDANPKWAKPYGSVSYQKDAFIVIKNKSRNPVVTHRTTDITAAPLLEHHQSLFIVFMPALMNTT